MFAKNMKKKKINTIYLLIYLFVGIFKGVAVENNNLEKNRDS